MSSAAERRTPPPPRKRDAFRYGVRLVRTRMPNGEIEYLRTPMPKEALLHPQDEDYPVESDPHDIDRTYLRNTISARLPQGWFLLSSCRVDWGVPGIEPHGPDISIFKGLRGKRKKWKTLYVAKEKVRPIAAIEITSASTRKNDLSIKVDEYYHAGVPLYAIVDARDRGDVRQIRILGYKSNRRGYEKMELDARGRLFLEPLGIWLGAEGEHVGCWDAKTGERLEDYDSLFQDREAAREEAIAARKAEKQAEEQIRRLQEEIKRLRGET